MPTEKVRVGIVGAGLIGQIHAAAIHTLPGAVLAAVCDPVPGKAADFVREVGPEKVVQIHEIMLSEIGQQFMATFISPKMLTDVSLTIAGVGDTMTV